MLASAAPTRSCTRFSIIEMKPWPSSPMRSASGTRTSWKNSSAVSDSVWPTLSSLRPRVNPSIPVSTPNRVIPRAFLDGSVRAATITRSALYPLVMKVFEPFRIQSSPSRTAVVLSAARSEPPLGSVIAIAQTSSPVQNRGSQRAFCSSVVSSTRYGAQTLPWMPKHEEMDAETRANSSATATPNR